MQRIPELALYDQQIHKYLSKTIPLTDVEITVILEVIWDWSREEMVEFLLEEIFKVIVLVLSRKVRKRGRRRGGRGRKVLLSQFFPAILETSVNRMVQMMQRNASWLSCVTCILVNWKKCQILKTEAKTPLTPQEEDEARVSLFKIKEILEKVMSGIPVVDDDPTEERDRVLSIIQKDTHKAANEIVQLILGYHTLDQDDKG